MQRLERIDDPHLALISALEGWQSKMWTAMPGEVIAFNADQQTCQVQVTLQAQIADLSGTRSWVALPPLVDCPVVFPSGGGATLTFPIKPGDEVLVVFASRCIDAWWQSGGVQQQAELRMHELSDGFVIPGPRSVPRVPGAISTTAVQLRSDDGDAVVSLNPTSHAVDVTTTGPATITAASLHITGPVTITGDVTVQGAVTTTGSVTTPALVSGGKAFNTHTHLYDGTSHTSAPE